MLVVWCMYICKGESVLFFVFLKSVLGVLERVGVERFSYTDALRY